MTRIPDAPYAGPQFRDTAVVTTQEVNNGVNNPPPGTVAHTVKPGDNLWDISGGNLAGIYQNNPQFNPQTGSRNPDLIYPGEVVFVPVQPGTPAATDAAAGQVADAQALSANTDSQVTYKEDRVADASADLEVAVRNEIAAGGDPAAIKTRLSNDPALDGVSDAAISEIVDRATTAPSASNPIGGQRPPLSPESTTNATALSYSQTEPTPVAPGPRAEARTAFVNAVRTELQQGGDVQEIKARYGNDPYLNGAIDEAAR